MSSMQIAFDGIKQVFDADAGLINWAQSNYKKKFTQLDDYQDITQIFESEYPATLFYVGDGATEIQVSNESMTIAFDIYAEFLFIENDHERAMARYKELLDLVILALMRNPTLDDTIDAAWVGEWQVSNPTLQPVRGARFKIVGSYQLSKN